MIRVLYDHQIFCNQRYGGISRYFCEVASRLSESSVEATIIAPLHSNEHLRRTSAAHLGCHVEHRRGLRRLTKPLGWLAGKGYCVTRRPHVVHETYYQRRSVAQKGAAVVVTVYDMIHERFRQMFGADDPTSAAKLLAVQRADKVICISEQTRRDLVHFSGIPEHKTLTIPLASSTLPPPSTRPAGDLAGRPYLLYVGERARYKNFARFLEAFAGSAPLRNDLSVVAFGGGPFRPDEREQIRSLELSPDHVRQVSGNDALLSRAYRDAVAFVYPSMYEGFGIPLLEAMSQDCPVLCSRASSFPEVAGNAARMFDPQDVDDMRAALEAVAFSEPERLDLIAKGRDRLTTFSWDRCARETAGVYKNLGAS